MASPGHTKQPRPAAILAAIALLGTLVAGIAAAHIQSEADQRFSYAFDRASYLFHDIRVARLARTEGRLAAAVNECRVNNRNPLRTVPLILLAPRLLEHRLGHLATELPALFVFLLVLGHTVFARTRSLPYAGSAIALFAAAIQLYRPGVGLAANWQDDVPAFLCAAAGLSLLLARAGDRRWLAAAAGLAAAAVLSRYVAAAYVGVTLTPLALAEIGRRSGRALTPGLRRVAMAAVGLAAVFLAAHLDSNIWYYAELGAYAIQQPFPATAGELAFRLRYAAGTRLVAVVALLFAANLAIPGDWSRWRAQWPLAWLASANLLFLLLVVRPVGVTTVGIYMLPLGITAALCPLPWRDSIERTRRARALGAAGLLAAVLVAGSHIRMCGGEAHAPSPENSDSKRLDRAVSAALAVHGEGLVWHSFHDAVAIPIALDAFFERGVLPMPRGQEFFSWHENFWKAYYPGRDPTATALRVYDLAQGALDVAVVLEDPARATAIFASNTAREVARLFARRLPADPRWRRIFTYDSAVAGRIVGYRNLGARDPDRYQRHLRERAW